MTAKRVSEKCETVVDFKPTPMLLCDKPAVLAYPAMGGGYMSLCEEHAVPHRAYCVTIAAAKRGEKPDYPPRPTPGERRA